MSHMTTSALDSVRNVLRDSEADTLIVSKRGHVKKISGFTGSSGILIVTVDSVALLTDGRYTEQAARETTGINISIIAGSPVNAACSNSLVQDSTLLLVQGESLTASDYVALRSALGASRVKVSSEVLDPILSAKSEDEIGYIQDAQAITDSVYRELSGWLLAGVSEREVAAKIAIAHLERGADKMSFDPIVAFGSNTSRPHARPGDRKLQPDDPVLVDFGCSLNGFCSDMTRMLVAGKPSGKLLEVVKIVSRAKDEAKKAAKAGMKCSDLDSVARELITREGYGSNFMHSLGHGIGHEVHEWPPVSQRSNAVLQCGDIITIEPGIYLPDQFGVRLEDMVCITDDGCTVLTGSTNDLNIVDLQG